KVEVFTLTGSQGKDIMGYTGDQIIADILDAYDAHVLYMSMIGDKGSPSGIVEVNIPDEWTDSDQVDTETSTIPTVPEQTSNINDPTTSNDQGGADHER